MEKPNLVGKTFNKLTVIKLNHIKNRCQIWQCKCVCGDTTLVKTAKLRNGHTKSCGCIQEKHNHAGNSRKGEKMSPEYKTWANMIQRCTNPNTQQYNDYGGRNITVCPEWKNSFKTFLKDMGNKPYKEASIERINNNEGYYPNNCKWASRIEQSHNRRITKSNTSGITGVTWVKRNNKWVARIGINGKRKNLGYFNTFDEAVQARLDAEQKYWNN